MHSPVRHGFWWSHVGWITSPPNFRTRLEVVPDLARYPELRFLDRYDVVVPLLFATWQGLRLRLRRTRRVGAPVQLSLGLDEAA